MINNLFNENRITCERVMNSRCTIILKDKNYNDMCQ